MKDFKAPPPPGGYSSAPVQPEQASGQQPAPEPQVVSEQQSPSAPMDPAVRPMSAKDKAMNAFQEQKDRVVGKFNALPSNKRQIILAALIFVAGLLIGPLLFGGSDEPVEQAPRGLQGVVSNPDIKEPLKRCGQVEASSPCVLYVMNSYTYEKLAEDFFETAVSVTRRKDLVIRMDNVRYATMRIPPGYFAQIKIPAYK